MEAKLADSAAQQGCGPDQLVYDALTRYLKEEARFVEAVKRGEKAFGRGGISLMSKWASACSGLENCLNGGTSGRCRSRKSQRSRRGRRNCPAGGETAPQFRSPC